MRSQNVGATISFGWHLNASADGGESELMPSISQRVINESIEIADHLTRRQAGAPRAPEGVSVPLAGPWCLDVTNLIARAWVGSGLERGLR